MVVGKWRQLYSNINKKRKKKEEELLRQVFLDELEKNMQMLKNYTLFYYCDGPTRKHVLGYFSNIYAPLYLKTKHKL